MHQLSLWKFISRHIDSSNPVILLCVVQSSGSSPGRTGFKMAVTKNEMTGSIGGGIMEHKFVELARKKLKETDSFPIIQKQFHQKSAGREQSGMICSGEQTLLLFPLQEEHLPAIQMIVSALETNTTGMLTLTCSEMLFKEATAPANTGFEMISEKDFAYRERIGYQNHLYIIGGGHCALALSKLMRGLDFYIHLFEEREDLNTLVCNDYVHEKRLVKEYAELAVSIPVIDAVPGIQNYVVVMTFGYRTDDEAVRALAGRPFRYFGVLGSESKMKQLFSEWRRDGLEEGWLGRIHAPIGEKIKSETPEEIAVSIAAQIIKIKNS